jgi:tetratricopeptide (TPR) repeat protein
MRILIKLMACAVAANAAASTGDTGPVTPKEQALLDRGFTVVQSTEQGEKVFCRKEADVGPRIPAKQICGTARQLEELSRQTQNAFRGGEAIAFASSENRHATRSAKSGTDRALCGGGEPQMAIESCSRIINDPGSSNEVRDPALRNRGWLLQSKGDLEGAIADYTAVLKLSPAEHKLNARTYVNRGVAYANKGDDKSALADYDQAVMLDPSVGSAYLNRAAVFVRRGEEDRALADLNEALRLEPKEASAYFNRGVLYAHRADAEHAMADFSTAISLNPKDAAVWRARECDHLS